MRKGKAYRARRDRRGWLGLLAGLALLSLPLEGRAQASVDEQAVFLDEMRTLETESRLLGLREELEAVFPLVGEASADALEAIDRRLSTIDTKWTAFYQARQAEIAEDDSLLQIVADYQLRKQALDDSIASRGRALAAHADFKEAEAYLAAQDSVYRSLREQALELSLAKALADQLELLKGKEQLLLAEAEGHYEKAKAAAEAYADLRPAFAPLEEKFIALKSESEKIQALEYKPFLDRIKDYLYGLAAVSMILLLLNTVQAKLKAAKQARENAKKLRELTRGENDDYPTI